MALISDQIIESIGEVATDWGIEEVFQPLSQQLAAGQITKTDLVSNVIGELATGFNAAEILEFFTTVSDYTPEANEFIVSNEVLNILQNAGGGNPAVVLSAFARAKGVFDSPGVQSFIGTVAPMISANIPLAPQVTAAVGTVTQIRRALDMILPHLNQNSIMGRMATNLSRALSAIVSKEGLAVLAAGTGAYHIYNNMAGIKAWWNGLTSKQKEEATPEEKKLVQVVDHIGSQLRATRLKEKALEQAMLLSASMNNGMSELQRKLVQGEYEDSVLSVLAAQLQQVLQDRMPLSEFSTREMKKRATKPAGSRSSNEAVGYPSSVIGIR